MIKKYINCLILFCIIILSLNSFADDVGVIYNDKIVIYKHIVSNFQKVLEDGGHKVKLVKYQKGNVGAMSKELSSKGVTYAFAVGAPSAKACDQSGYPGVFTMVVDPIRTGLIDKNGMSVGQMTGVLVNVSPSTQFTYLKKIMPNKTKAGVIYNPNVSKYVVSEYVKASTNFGFQIYESPVSSKAEVPPTVEGMKRKVDFIMAVVDPTVYNVQSIQIILRFSLTNKVPLIGFSPQQVKAGGLIAFYCDYPKLGTQAGNMMQALIDSGGDISTLFVELPNDTKYAINVQTAKIMKVNFSSDFKKGASLVYGE